MANEISTEVNQFLNTLPDNRVSKSLVIAFQKILPKTAISAGTALIKTRALHSSGVVNLDTLTGSTVTLPPATGSGAKYQFRVSVLATSNSHIVKTGGTDKLEGFATLMSATNTVGMFAAVAGVGTTLTLNRTTTGSVTIGELITVVDVAAGRYNMDAVLSNTGVVATPFS